eukprot:COSAG06_NODE_67567_length_251_cov_1.026316_2_plen_47_part_01
MRAPCTVASSENQDVDQFDDDFGDDEDRLTTVCASRLLIRNDLGSCM